MWFRCFRIAHSHGSNWVDLIAIYTMEIKMWSAESDAEAYDHYIGIVGFDLRAHLSVDITVQAHLSDTFLLVQGMGVIHEVINVPHGPLLERTF